ncbi:MAG: LEA type 2 family protein [Myxococcota bacterium]
MISRLIFCAALLSSTSCATLSELTKGAFKKPTLTYKDVELRDLSLGGVTMDFVFELNNPNGVGIKLASLDYQLDFEGKKFVAGETEQAIEVAANGSSEVRLPLSVEFEKLAESVMALLSAKEQIAYRLATGFGVNTPIGLVRIPAETDGDLPLPKLPKIRMGKVEMDDIGFTGTTVRFSVEVQNRSSFPIGIKGLNYSLSLGEVDVSEGETAASSVEASETTTLEIPVRLEFLKLGASVVNIIRSKKIPYDFRGELNLGLFAQPFELTGTAEL